MGLERQLAFLCFKSVNHEPNYKAAILSFTKHAFWALLELFCFLLPSLQFTGFHFGVWIHSDFDRTAALNVCFSWTIIRTECFWRRIFIGLLIHVMNWPWPVPHWAAPGLGTYSSIPCVPLGGGQGGVNGGPLWQDVDPQCPHPSDGQRVSCRCSSAIKPYLCASCLPSVCFIVTVSALCGENLLKLLVHRCKEQLSWAPRGLLPHFLLNTWPRVFAEGDLAVCPSWLVSSPCPCEPPDTYHQLHLHSVFVSISSPHTLTVP